VLVWGKTAGHRADAPPQWSRPIVPSQACRDIQYLIYYEEFVTCSANRTLAPNKGRLHTAMSSVQGIACNGGLRNEGALLSPKGVPITSTCGAGSMGIGPIA
jgi:hypothetical protein